MKKFFELEMIVREKAAEGYQVDKDYYKTHERQRIENDSPTFKNLVDVTETLATIDLVQESDHLDNWQDVNMSSPEQQMDQQMISQKIIENIESAEETVYRFVKQNYRNRWYISKSLEIKEISQKLDHHLTNQQAVLYNYLAEINKEINQNTKMRKRKIKKRKTKKRKEGRQEEAKKTREQTYEEIEKAAETLGFVITSSIKRGLDVEEKIRRVYEVYKEKKDWLQSLNGKIDDLEKEYINLDLSDKKQVKTQTKRIRKELEEIEYSRSKKISHCLDYGFQLVLHRVRKFADEIPYLLKSKEEIINKQKKIKKDTYNLTVDLHYVKGLDEPQVHEKIILAEMEKEICPNRYRNEKLIYLGNDVNKYDATVSELTKRIDQFLPRKKEDEGREENEGREKKTKGKVYVEISDIQQERERRQPFFSTLYKDAEKFVRRESEDEVDEGKVDENRVDKDEVDEERVAVDKGKGSKYAYNNTIIGPPRSEGKDFLKKREIRKEHPLKTPKNEIEFLLFSYDNSKLADDRKLREFCRTIAGYRKAGCRMTSDLRFESMEDVSGGYDVVRHNDMRYGSVIYDDMKYDHRDLLSRVIAAEKIPLRNLQGRDQEIHTILKDSIRRFV